MIEETKSSRLPQRRKSRNMQCDVTALLGHEVYTETDFYKSYS